MKVRANTWDSLILESVLVRNEYGLPQDMRGMVVMDIGAHIGAFAIACQKRGAKRVVCFEPDPENVRLLAVNVDEDIESRTEIIVMEAAIAAESRDDLGIRRLTNHDYNNGRNTGHVDVFGEADGTECIGINEAIESIGGPIDILKMDCEGAEWGIFDKADFSKVRALVAELHALPDGPHPALDNYRGQSLTDLTTNAVKKLRNAGFETTVTYDSLETAHVIATKMATVSAGEDRKPRVLVVSDAGMTTGYAKVAENICRRLVKRGWDVRVLGIGYNGDPHNYPYKIYPAVDPNTGGAPNGMTRIKDIIARLKPDVALIQDDSWNVGHILDNMAALNTMIPTVGYVAVDSENVREDVAMQLRNLRHAVCHTQFGIDQLQKAGYNGPVSISPHGVDTYLYKRYDRQESREGIPIPNVDKAFIWGSVAVNQPRKRLDLTIAYWSAWWKAAGSPGNAYLYLHTNANGSWDIKQLASYHGIRGRLYETHGGQVLPDGEMPTLYNSFDAMISTAEGESFGIPLLEGMACGVPQIAIRCGGAPSWAGNAVYWVEPSYYQFTSNRSNTKRWIASEADFVNAMQSLYESAQLRDEYTKRGLALAATLKWDDAGEHFDKVLRQVLAVKRTAAKTATDALSEY